MKDSIFHALSLIFSARKANSDFGMKISDGAERSPTAGALRDDALRHPYILSFFDLLT
jgi:hypothetical protein